MGATQFRQRSAGRLAYEVTGEGRLVLCSPGLGDLRSTFTEIVGPLAEAGFRVATTDLRGHGESSAHWPSYTEMDVATDLLDLAASLDERPAVLLGNSFSGGAAVVAAATQPDAVAGIVLTGPFVRDHPKSFMDDLSLRLVTLPGIGRHLWTGYWPKLFGTTKPEDLADRRRKLAANLAEPGRFAAVRAMLRADHEAAEKALPNVKCPALVVMGDADPDFADPAAEAQFAADNLGGSADVLMVPGGGHYPHAAPRPGTVAEAVVEFLRKLD